MQRVESLVCVPQASFPARIAVTGFLTALLLVVVEAVPQPSTSLLLSNLLQSAIVLWAALCSLLCRRSKAYLRNCGCC